VTGDDRGIDLRDEPRAAHEGHRVRKGPGSAANTPVAAVDAPHRKSARMTRLRARGCPTCGTAAARQLGPLSNTTPHAFSVGEFSLLQCQDCDMIFLGQALTEADFRRLYRQSTRFHGDVYRDEDHIAGARSYYGGCYRQMAAEMSLAPFRVLHLGGLGREEPGSAWLPRRSEAP
jgi:hypothetical protein